MQEIQNILEQWRTNPGNVSEEDKMSLYTEAKKLYYNSGEPLMEDFEFDELEADLGLENKSEVGATSTYTVKHPFIMGSLSKVQIHKNAEGVVDWAKHFSEVCRFIEPNIPLIITPKFDGCSFEIVVKNGKILSVSSRGNSYYGKDYSKHLASQISEMFIKHPKGSFTYRGEVLIGKSTFESKYSEYVNPRSFVSGVLNQDYSEENFEIYEDLYVVIYDIREKVGRTWTDREWTDFTEYIDSRFLPGFYMMGDTTKVCLKDKENLAYIYRTFEMFRNTMCEFALDGIVIKPTVDNRINNLTEGRPKDCVAIKFIPMLEETEVVDIEWKLGKSGEWVPKVITKPVIMDGKSVCRAKANNIGYLLDNKISIGTKLVLSLAGDIIPFIYKVTDTSKFDENKICHPAIGKSYVDGCHLMAQLSEEELAQEKLRNSILTLNIDGIGGAGANVIVEYMKKECAGDEFFGIEPKPFPTNVFMVTPDMMEKALGGKTGSNVRKAYEKLLKELTLKTVIKSFNFKLCGDKVATQIENFFLEKGHDFSSMAHEGYAWCMKPMSEEMMQLERVLEVIGYSIEDFKNEYDAKVSSGEYRNTADLIPVILTGEPNEYKSKGDFLNCNPQYRSTGSWKEVKIVFTNDLNSTTSKMKKAKEKGIEIRLY